jgi:glycerol uptake facilitator-like aquaporin
MFSKNKLAMLVGEFLGTAALTLTVLSVSRQLGLAYFVAFAAGLIIILMTLALAGISGAIFNPAMTIGLWTVRKLRTYQALLYIIAQLLGGAAAYWLFTYFLKQHLTNNGSYNARVLVAEAVGTFIFAFGWAAAVYQRFDLRAKAATIGGSLAAGAIVASLGSAGFVNPAVALGARNWSWGTYVLGPVIGAIVGFNLYNLLFVETEVAEAAATRVTKVTTVKAATTRTKSARTTRPAAKKKTARRK